MIMIIDTCAKCLVGLGNDIIISIIYACSTTIFGIPQKRYICHTNNTYKAFMWPIPMIASMGFTVYILPVSHMRCIGS